MGFDSVWLSERVAIPLDKPHPYDPMIDPWTGLAFVASVTERVKLGTSVSQIALRPPVLMARELATLDRLSEGRLIVGAGAGWVEEEFTSTGVEFATRGGRLNEFIQALRHLWTTPENAWEGKYFSIPPIGIVMPLTPGGPPVYVGAGGSPGLRRAAKYGDGFISVTVPPDGAAKLVTRLKELREKYERSEPFPILVQAKPPAAGKEALETVEQYGEAGVDGLILTYEGAPPESFRRNEESISTLMEAAHRTG